MLKLIDTKNEVVDSISISYEDSFTLESFQDMIEASHLADKSFILARVSTVDPKQPEKSFYSYYNAYQLNKVLFQTQLIKGKKYIHRLHVLNPLSNLDIVGDVLYFHVKPIKTKFEEDKIKSKADIIPSEAAVKADAKSPAQWTLAGPISSPFSDDLPDDDFKPSNDRAYTYPVVRPVQMIQIKENTTINMLDKPYKISPQKLDALSVSIAQRKISIIPKGTVTRFNTPISEKPVSLKKGNRRAFSWMNTNNGLKKQLSFEEWKSFAINYKKSNEDEDFDKVEIIQEEKGSVPDAQKELEYEAILFATDDDYLQSVKIRSFFRENAISPDDTKLFAMPTVEEELNLRQRQSLDEIRGIYILLNTSGQSGRKMLSIF